MFPNEIGSGSTDGMCKVLPPPTHTHTLSLSLSLTHTHTLSLSLTHTLTFTHPPTHPSTEGGTP